MPSIKVQNNSRMEIEITDWRFLAKELRKVEPKVMSRFKREAREIGKPVERAIKKAIPTKLDYHLRGMVPKVVPGRMSWGAGVSPRKTSLVINTRSYKRKGTSIVSVWAWSPALSMLDLAKNAGRGDGTQTREYKYSRATKKGTRRHRINGQGQGLLAGAAKSTKLLRADRPSRIVWPAAWKAIPEVNADMNKFIESEARKINAVMRRK